MEITMRNRHLKHLRIVGILAVLSIFCWGCETIPKQPLDRLKPSAFPVFGDDMSFDGLPESIQRSLDYLYGKPPDKMFRFGADQYPTTHLIASLQAFLTFIESRPSRQELERFIKEYYLVYRSIGDQNRQVLFTGYYEPFLEGSRQENEIFRYPVYGRPADLVTIDLSQFSEKYENERLTGRLSEQYLIPYYDRRQIDQGVLLGDNASIIAWVKDPVDLFFLHIQGSGRIYLQDGGVLIVHYHASNGKPYRSIGRLLIDEAKIPREEMSMQRIKAYLKEHPEELADILNYNPSYVFFKTETEGPLGYLDVKLTPGRSIALDYRLFPLPALTFIEASKPVLDANGSIDSWQPFKRFVISQDTGGAIRGPGRADIFWGNGAYAETAAGHLKHRGQLYMLIKKLPPGQ